MWPKVKKTLEFAWMPGGWDADRDGVMEGVQHNTYDVEFYGPNPMCGIHYLGGLRAGEEMARATGDAHFAGRYRRCSARAPLDRPESVQRRVLRPEDPRRFRATKSPTPCRSDRRGGPRASGFPAWRGLSGGPVGRPIRGGFRGPRAAGLPANIRKTMQSIYKYNYKRNARVRLGGAHLRPERRSRDGDLRLRQGERPQIPFPYFAEVMTGFELRRRR